jgi:hypothetical protein
MPRLISHHTPHRQSRRPRRGLNRPARARPVADAAALYCVQQKVLSLADCDDRLWWHPYSHGTLLVTMSFVSACQIRTGASVTCAPVRKASDGMLLSGVPIPGCRSPLPLGPTFAFQIGLGLANRRRREGHWQPTSVTALGGILVGDGRVAAGVSELGPAMSDGESGFPANYSRSGPTIIRDYSRRPRRGRAHAPDYGAAEPGLRSHWPRIKVGSGNLNRGRRQLKPGPEAT